jgi:hypothetical protein
MFRERRNSFRCPIQSLDGPALLKVGSKEIVVQLVEESAGGFGVIADEGAAKLKEGQPGLLATTSGRFEVSVSHITNVDEKMRVGLNRLADLEGDNHAGLFGSTRSVALLLLGICSLFFFWGTAFPSTWWHDIGLGGSRLSQTNVGSDPRQSDREQLILRSCRLLDELTSREFRESLQLTQVQQQRIAKIVEKTNKSLDQITNDRGAADSGRRIDVGLGLIATAWLEVQEVLTDEQKMRWKELLQS